MNQSPQAQLYDFWQQPQSQCHHKQHILPWKKYKTFTHENWLHCIGKTTAVCQLPNCSRPLENVVRLTYDVKKNAI